MSRLKDIPELARDSSNLGVVMSAVREAIQTFRGYRGDALDKALTKRDAIDTGILLANGTFSGSSVPGPIGPVGPAGPSGSTYTPDLTAPPTATGLTVTAGLSSIYISCDTPVYTQGHGHERTVVYGAKWPSGIAPTFSSAVELFTFQGTFSAYPSNMGTRWCIWIKWQSVDAVKSVDTAGGTNGVQATTGVIGTTDMGPLIVEAGNLASGAVTASKVAAAALDATKFASAIEPITMVTGAVPGVKSTSTIFRTDDGKLYRWNGSAYVSTIPTTDLSGTVTDAQIAGMAAAKVTGTLTDAQIAAIAAAKVTGTLTNAQIADLAATKITGQITTTQITDSAITTAKVNAGAIVAGKIAANAVTATEIAAGSITTAKIAAGAVSAAEIAAGAIVAGKIAAGAIVAADLAAGTITSAKIAAGTIQASNIAAGTITGNEMLANSVDADRLVANSITAGKIAAGAIGADQIAAKAITSEKLVLTPGNLIANGDFGTGDLANWRPWATPANFSVILASTVGVPAGAPTRHVGQFVATGATVSAFACVRAYSDAGADSDGIAVTFGDELHASLAMTKTSDLATGGSIQLLGFFWKADGTYTTQVAALSIAVGGITTSWATYSASVIVPADAQRCWMYVFAPSISAGTLWFTNLRVTKKASASLIVDGAIIATKLAANAIAVGTLAVQNGALVNAMIGDATIDSAKIATLSASKLTVGDGSIGGNLKSTVFTSGSAGWLMQPNGNVEFNNATVRGTMYASAGLIGGNTIDATGMQSAGYIAGSSGWRFDTTGLIKAYASTGARVLDMSATGSSPVLKIGSALEVLANGSATFGGDISAATGTFAGGLNVTPGGTGARIEIKTNVIKVYDASNVLRVRIGDLTA